MSLYYLSFFLLVSCSFEKLYSNVSKNSSNDKIKYFSMTYKNKSLSNYKQFQKQYQFNSKKTHHLLTTNNNNHRYLQVEERYNIIYVPGGSLTFDGTMFLSNSDNSYLFKLDQIEDITNTNILWGNGSVSQEEVTGYEFTFSCPNCVNKHFTSKVFLFVGNSYEFVSIIIFIICGSNCERCNPNSNICEKCEYGYAFLENDYTKCVPTSLYTSNNYFHKIESNQLIRCYDSCDNCLGEGTESTHFCQDCPDNEYIYPIEKGLTWNCYKNCMGELVNGECYLIVYFNNFQDNYLSTPFSKNRFY